MTRVAGPGTSRTTSLTTSCTVTLAGGSACFTRTTSGDASTRPTARAAAVHAALALRTATGTRLHEHKTFIKGTMSCTGVSAGRWEKSMTSASWSKKSALSPSLPYCCCNSTPTCTQLSDFKSSATRGSCALLISKLAGLEMEVEPAEGAGMKTVFAEGETKAGKSYLIDRAVSTVWCPGFADVHNFFQ